MDGSLNIDWKQMSVMLGPALQQQLQQRLSPSQLQALREAEAFVTQLDNRITVEVRFREGDASADAAVRGLLLDGLIGAIPHVTKSFGCRAFVRRLKNEEGGEDGTG